jgi:glycosyltransferase involved in cell wall biosynthesis
MRVIWISHSGELYGAERSLVEGVRGLAEKGIEIHAVVASRGRLAHVLNTFNVPISVIRTGWWMTDTCKRSLRRNFGDILSAWRELSRLIKRIRPDLIVTNTLTIPFGALAAKSTGIPHVWYLHELGEIDQGLLFCFGESLSLKLINKLSRRIIVNSIRVQDHFQQYIPPEKLRLVSYAVEVPPQPSISPQNDASLVVILVGRVTADKRQEDAIRAVSLLVNRGLSIRLMLVGTSNTEYDQYLCRLANQLGIDKCVDFIAFTENPFSYFARSDVALMCSRHEAFGRVTVEAMKLKKPVIGANTGGTVELIQDGWNGFLYESGNIEDLARKIEILYKNRPLLVQMGINAESWANRTFNLDKYAASLLKVFTEVVNERNSNHI